MHIISTALVSAALFTKGIQTHSHLIKCHPKHPNACRAIIQVDGIHVQIAGDSRNIQKALKELTRSEKANEGLHEFKFQGYCLIDKSRVDTGIMIGCTKSQCKKAVIEMCDTKLYENGNEWDTFLNKQLEM